MDGGELLRPKPTEDDEVDEEDGSSIIDDGCEIILLHERVAFDVDLDNETLAGGVQLTLLPVKSPAPKHIVLQCRVSMIASVAIGVVPCSFSYAASSAVEDPSTLNDEDELKSEAKGPFGARETAEWLRTRLSQISRKEGDSIRNGDTEGNLFIQFPVGDGEDAPVRPGVPFDLVVQFHVLHPWPSALRLVRSPSSVGAHPMVPHCYTVTGLPGSAHAWRPCLEGNSCCTRELIITAPANLMVIASGTLESSYFYNDAKMTWWYVVSTPVANSAIGFSIGPYVVLPDPQFGASLTHFALSGGSDEKERKLELESTTRAMGALVAPWLRSVLRLDNLPRESDLQTWFLPYRSHTQTFVGDFLEPDELVAIPPAAGAGLFSSSLLHPDKAIDETARSCLAQVEGAIRQWFGSFLSPRADGDLWLVEGIVNYLLLNFIKEAAGPYEYAAQLHAQAAFVREHDSRRLPPLCPQSFGASFGGHEQIPNEEHTIPNLPSLSFPYFFSRKAGCVLAMIERRAGESGEAELCRVIADCVADGVRATAEFHRKLQELDRACRKPLPGADPLSRLKPLIRSVVDARRHCESATKLSTRSFLRNVKKRCGIDARQGGDAVHHWIHYSGCPRLSCEVEFIDGGRSVEVTIQNPGELTGRITVQLFEAVSMEKDKIDASREGDDVSAAFGVLRSKRRLHPTVDEVVLHREQARSSRSFISRAQAGKKKKYIRGKSASASAISSPIASAGGGRSPGTPTPILGEKDAMRAAFLASSEQGAAAHQTPGEEVGSLFESVEGVSYVRIDPEQKWLLARRRVKQPPAAWIRLCAGSSRGERHRDLTDDTEKRVRFHEEQRPPVAASLLQSLRQRVLSGSEGQSALVGDNAFIPPLALFFPRAFFSPESRTAERDEAEGIPALFEAMEALCASCVRAEVDEHVDEIVDVSEDEDEGGEVLPEKAQRTRTNADRTISFLSAVEDLRKIDDGKYSCPPEWACVAFASLLEDSSCFWRLRSAAAFALSHVATHLRGAQRQQYTDRLLGFFQSCFFDPSLGWVRPNQFLLPRSLNSIRAGIAAGEEYALQTRVGLAIGHLLDNPLSPSSSALGRRCRLLLRRRQRMLLCEATIDANVAVSCLEGGDVVDGGGNSLSSACQDDGDEQEWEEENDEEEELEEEAREDVFRSVRVPLEKLVQGECMSTWPFLILPARPHFLLKESFSFLKDLEYRNDSATNRFSDHMYLSSLIGSLRRAPVEDMKGVREICIHFIRQAGYLPTFRHSVCRASVSTLLALHERRARLWFWFVHALAPLDSPELLSDRTLWHKTGALRQKRRERLMEWVVIFAKELDNEAVLGKISALRNQSSSGGAGTASLDVLVGVREEREDSDLVLEEIHQELEERTMMWDLIARPLRGSWINELSEDCAHLEKLCAPPVLPELHATALRSLCHRAVLAFALYASCPRRDDNGIVGPLPSHRGETAEAVEGQGVVDRLSALLAKISSWIFSRSDAAGSGLVQRQGLSGLRSAVARLRSIEIREVVNVDREMAALEKWRQRMRQKLKNEWVSEEPFPEEEPCDVDVPDVSNWWTPRIDALFFAPRGPASPNSLALSAAGLGSSSETHVDVAGPAGGGSVVSPSDVSAPPAAAVSSASSATTACLASEMASHLVSILVGGRNTSGMTGAANEQQQQSSSPVAFPMWRVPFLHAPVLRFLEALCLPSLSLYRLPKTSSILSGQARHVQSVGVRRRLFSLGIGDCGFRLGLRKLWWTASLRPGGAGMGGGVGMAKSGEEGQKVPLIRLQSIPVQQRHKREPTPRIRDIDLIEEEDEYEKQLEREQRALSRSQRAEAREAKKQQEEVGNVVRLTFPPSSRPRPAQHVHGPHVVLSRPQAGSTAPREESATAETRLAQVKNSWQAESAAAAEKMEITLDSLRLFRVRRKEVGGRERMSAVATAKEAETMVDGATDEQAVMLSERKVETNANEEIVKELLETKADGGTVVGAVEFPSAPAVAAEVESTQEPKDEGRGNELEKEQRPTSSDVPIIVAVEDDSEEALLPLVQLEREDDDDDAAEYIMDGVQEDLSNPVVAIFDPLTRAMRRFLSNVISLDDQSFFRYPVPRAQYPDYYRLVSHPICLAIIVRRFRRGYYHDVAPDGIRSLRFDSVEADLQRLCANCMFFNEEGSALFQHAKDFARGCAEMCSRFRQEMRLVVPLLPEQKPLPVPKLKLSIGSGKKRKRLSLGPERNGVDAGGAAVAGERAAPKKVKLSLKIGPGTFDDASASADASIGGLTSEEVRVLEKPMRAGERPSDAVAPETLRKTPLVRIKVPKPSTPASAPVSASRGDTAGGTVENSHPPSGPRRLVVRIPSRE